jgi:hypothetical protein
MIDADNKIDLEKKWKKNPEAKRPKKEKDDGAADFEDDAEMEGEDTIKAGAKK